jgi:hypothetical protein
VLSASSSWTTSKSCRIAANWLLQSAIAEVARQAKSRALAAVACGAPEIATSATIGAERSAEPATPARRAQREAVASGDEMLVGAAKEVCAGAVGRRHSRIVTAVQQPWIRRGPRFDAIAGKKVRKHSGRHCLEFPRDAREVPPVPGQSRCARSWAEA